MSDMRERTSEVWKGLRKGAGWAMGVGIVVSAAGVLREGPRAVVKAAIKAGLRGGEMAAELTEQMRDLYAEVQVERHAQPPPVED
ncbi:MAG: hypothetical protein M3N53_03025 [Actinomycetota bacterium]|nr:hypothetical protein [Actinomycetota bacterium]